MQRAVHRLPRRGGPAGKLLLTEEHVERDPVADRPPRLLHQGVQAPSDAPEHVVAGELQALEIGRLQPVGGDLEKEDRRRLEPLAAARLVGDSTTRPGLLRELQVGDR
jgi:hypothetical protein